LAAILAIRHEVASATIAGHLDVLYVVTKPCIVLEKTSVYVQESRVVARKPRDAVAVLFGLNFADNIHYKFKNSQASKARLQSSKHTGAKQNLTQNGHSVIQGHVFWSQWKGDKGLSNTKY